MFGEKFSSIGRSVQGGLDYWSSALEQHWHFGKEIKRVLSHGSLEHKVNSFLDKQGPPSPEVAQAYFEQKRLLTELFGDIDGKHESNFFFHGTGKYKYPGRKYLEAPKYDEPVEVLSPIFSDGIKKQYDSWLVEKEAETVSLAQSYLYAKCYADRHMSDENELKWQLGDPNDWWFHFLGDTILKEFSPKNAVNLFRDREAIQETRQKRGNKFYEGQKLWIWYASFIKDVGKYGDSSELLKQRSDIPDDWGVVLCIEKDVSAKPIKYGGAHELRTEESIPASKIKAVGAPLARMEEMRQILEKTGRTDIKIFALECADIHLANFDTKDLAKRVE